MPSKNLSITVQFQTSVAKKDAAAFSTWLTQRFEKAGRSFAKSMGVGDISKIKAQFTEMQTMMKGVRGPKGISKTFTDLEQADINLGKKQDTYFRKRKADILRSRRQLATQRKNIGNKILKDMHVRVNREKVLFDKSIKQHIDYVQKSKALIKLGRAPGLAAARDPVKSPYYKTLFSKEQLNNMKEATKQIKAVRSAAGAMGVSPGRVKALGLDPKEIDRLSNAFMTLQRASKKAQGGMVGVNRVIKDIKSDVVVKGQGTVLGVNPQEIGKSVAVIERLGEKSKDVKNIARDMGIQYGKAHGRFAKLAASTMNYMKFQAGWFLGASVIFGIIGAIRGMAVAALDFAQALKDIQAVTGATASQIELISESAKQIAITTPMAATEAVKMGLQLIRAGLDAEVAARAMRTAAKVAVVAGEDAKTVADTIATAIMAWKQFSEDDIQRIGNTLAASMNFSRLQVEDLGTAFNYLAGVMSAFNKDFEETNAILAVFSNLGVRASTIATGLVQLFSQLAAPTEKSRKALEQLKDTTTGLFISLDQLNPLTHSFASILETLEKTGFTAAQALDVLETRAGRALIFALRAGSKEFRRMEETIKKSRQLTEGLARVMEGPKAAFKVLINQITNSAIEIGQVLTPALVDLTKILSIFTETLFHAVHLLSKMPLRLIAWVTAGGFLIKMLMALRIQMIATLGMSTGKSILMMTGLIGTLRNATFTVEGLTFALRALMAAMPGTWIGRLLMLGGTIAGAGLIDKILFGKKGTDVTKMKDELDTVNNQIKKFEGELQNFEGSADDASSAANRFRQSVEDLMRPSTLATESIFTQYTKQIDEFSKKLIDLQKLQVRNRERGSTDTVNKIIAMQKERDTFLQRQKPGTRFEFQYTVFGRREYAKEIEKYNEAINNLSEMMRLAADVETSALGQVTAHKEKHVALLDEIKNKTFESMVVDAKRNIELKKEGISLDQINEKYNAQLSEITKIEDATKRTIHFNTLVKGVLSDIVKTLSKTSPATKTFLGDITNNLKIIKQTANDAIKGITHIRQLTDIRIGGSAEVAQIRLDKEQQLNERFYNEGIITLRQYWLNRVDIQKRLGSLEVNNIKQSHVTALKELKERISIEKDLLDKQLKDSQSLSTRFAGTDKPGDQAVIQKKMNALNLTIKKQRDSIKELNRELERLQAQYGVDLPKAIEQTGNALEDIQFQASKVDIESSFQALTMGMKSASAQWQDVTANMQLAGQNVAENMKNSFSDFFDHTSENFLNFGRLATNVLNNIARQMMEAQLVKPLVGGLSSALNSFLLTRHTGGMIPSLHTGGMRHDERLTMMKVGERAITKEQNDWLNRQGGNQNINMEFKVENKTGTPVNAKQGDVKFDGKKYVIGIVLENITQGGVLRTAMGGNR